MTDIVLCMGRSSTAEGIVRTGDRVHSRGQLGKGECAGSQQEHQGHQGQAQHAHTDYFNVSLTTGHTNKLVTTQDLQYDCTEGVSLLR